MTILIKKYKNRRLYDTHTSQYITIEDLKRYVIDGITFKVADVNSGNDLTNATLLQIIVEMENDTTQFLSTEMLRQLIYFANHPQQKAMQEIIEHFFITMRSPIETNSFMGSTEHWIPFLNQWRNL